MNFSDPTGALQRYQQALGSGRQSYDQALAQQLATMQQPVDRRGALMRMAQGFLSPTKTGGFAENLGLAVGNYADANDKTREQEMDRAMKLAQIQAARAKLQMEGAGQDFDLFSKGSALMGEQRRRQAWDAFDSAPAGGQSLQAVAQMAEQGVTPMPGGFEATPILDPMGFNAPLASGNVTRANTRKVPLEPMTEDGEALPRRENVVPPGPAPMQDLGAVQGEAMAEYASGSGQNPLFSPQMAITPDQMQQFRPQQPAQQAAMQQPVQPPQQSRAASPEMQAVAQAEQTLERLYSPQGRAARQADPEGWQAREKAALETMNKFATTDTRNYGMAQRDPAFLDFLRQQAEAKSTRINNVVGGQEGAFDSKAGGFVAEQAAGAYEQAARQQERLRQYQQIVGLLSDPNVFTGAGGQTIANLKQFGRTFLGMEGIEGVANVEAAERIRAALFAGFRSEMLTGATSNADREFVMRIPPNVSDSNEGLQLILTLQERAAQTAEKRAALFDDLVRESPSGSLNMRDYGEYRRRLAEIDTFSSDDMQAVVDVARKNAEQKGPLAGLPLDRVPSGILQEALGGFLTREEVEAYLASQGKKP